MSPWDCFLKLLKGADNGSEVVNEWTKPCPRIIQLHSIHRYLPVLSTNSNGAIFFYTLGLFTVVKQKVQFSPHNSISGIHNV